MGITLLPRLFPAIILSTCFFVLGASAGRLPSSCPRPTRAPALNPNNIPTSIEQALQTLNNTMMSILEENGLSVGAYVGIVSGDNVIFSQGYNYMSTTNRSPVTENSLFRIGSVSKLFTVMEMLHLWQRHIIDLDVDISLYAPDFQVSKPPTEPSVPLSFRKIASQISGLAREVPCAFYATPPICYYNNSEIFKRYRDQPLLFPPDTMPSYSNMGFALIGNVLGSIEPLKSLPLLHKMKNCEEIAGTETCAFVNGLHVDIFRPLRMDNTGFAYLYDVDGDVVEGHLNGYHATGSLLSYGWQSPASSLFSCGKDIMRFLSFLLNRDGSNANNFPLHASTVRDWLLPRFSNPDGASAFGMPWEMFFVASESVPGRGYWSYNKAGDVPGYSTEVSLIPDLNYGLVAFLSTEPPADVVIAMAAAAGEIMVDALSEYYDSLPQLKSLPTNYSIYEGTYYAVVGEAGCGMEYISPSVPFFGGVGPLPAPLAITIERAAPDEEVLTMTITVAGIPLSKSYLTRPDHIVGPRDYWQLLSSTSNDPTVPYNCLLLEGGYEYVPVEFKIDEKKEEVYAMSIPSVLYGVSFTKK